MDDPYNYVFIIQLILAFRSGFVKPFHVLILMGRFIVIS